MTCEVFDSAQTGGNKLLGNLKLQSILGPEGEQLQRTSPFLGWEMFKDLDSSNDYNEYVPVADDFKELVRQVEEAVQKDRGGTGIPDPMGSNSYLWARYPRRKRESLGLAGMCCKWGCTKAEISTICRV
nr:PREDICTED: relaxin-3-like [Haliaeetus albicilla]